jgi:hypothetical protein
MELNFLFMDECSCSETSITSLTGLLVPALRYNDLRERFYEMLKWSMRTDDGAKKWPPELHGRKFLPDEDDERRLRTFEEVVNLVISNQLRVYRVGYFVTPSLRRMFVGDETMIGMCWFGMVALLQPEFEDALLVPIMDTCDSKTFPKFSQLIKCCDVFRAWGIGECNMSFKNTHNVLGEVFYAYSQYSVFIQVVDIISYLRHIADWAREGIGMSNFKGRLVPIAEKAARCLAREEIVAMNGERPAGRGIEIGTHVRGGTSEGIISAFA